MYRLVTRNFRGFILMYGIIKDSGQANQHYYRGCGQPASEPKHPGDVRIAVARYYSAIAVDPAKSFGVT